MPESTPIYIHAAAALGPQLDLTQAERLALTADPKKSNFKELVKQLYGQSLRQASHLIEMAMVGAGVCHRRLGRNPEPDCALYVGTGLGELEKTIALFYQIMPPANGMASPFDFINASNNMAAFYVAKSLTISARNLTISQDEFSFEWALHLALSDLRHGATRQALVGGIDEFVEDRAYHLLRFPVAEDQILGEGGGWLFLDREPEGALGALLMVEKFPDIAGEAARDWAARIADGLRPALRDDRSIVMLPGFRLKPEETGALQQQFPGGMLQTYLDYCGAFPTAAAFGIAAVFDHLPETPTCFVHINRDLTGQTMVVVVKA